MQIMLKMFQNIISGSEHKCASENLRRKKQKMNTGKKTIEEKTNHFIGKYAATRFFIAFVNIV